MVESLNAPHEKTCTDGYSSGGSLTLRGRNSWRCARPPPPFLDFPRGKLPFQAALPTFAGRTREVGFLFHPALGGNSARTAFSRGRNLLFRGIRSWPQQDPGSASLQPAAGGGKSAPSEARRCAPPSYFTSRPGHGWVGGWGVETRRRRETGVEISFTGPKYEKFGGGLWWRFSFLSLPRTKLCFSSQGVFKAAVLAARSLNHPPSQAFQALPPPLKGSLSQVARRRRRIRHAAGGGGSVPRPIPPSISRLPGSKLFQEPNGGVFGAAPGWRQQVTHAGGIGRRRCLTLNSPAAAAGRRSPPPFPALTSAPGPVGLLLDFPRSCCKASHAATTQRRVLGGGGRHNALSTHIRENT